MEIALVLAGVAAVIWLVLRRRPASQLRPRTLDDMGRQTVDFRQQMPPGFEVLIQGPGLEVTGESFHRDAIESIVGRWAGGHNDILDAVIAAELDNPHDPNAVGVFIGGKLVGHIPAAQAPRWRPVLAWYEARGIKPVVRANVRGGWQRDDGQWADFGITLYVASPEQLAERQAEA